MTIAGQVFVETDYDMFKRLQDNRDVTGSRVGKLIASISEKYIFNPIIVNEKMEIIDGQGRYEALKALKKPVYYVIAPGTTSEDCRRMNKYNTKWSPLDFARSHASGGNQNYANLLLACKKSGLPISQILRITNKGTTISKDNPQAMSIFERGDLVFTEEDIEETMAVKTAMEEIINELQFSGRRNDAFVYAVKVMIDTAGYNHQRMISHCAMCRSTYRQMGSLADQLVEFDRIYNFKTSAKNRLYFSDYMRNKGRNVRVYESSNTMYIDKDVSTLKSEEKEAN